MARAAALALGIAAGAGISLAATTVLTEPARETPLRGDTPGPTVTGVPAPRARSEESVLLVWSPMGLPQGLEDRLAGVRGVDAVTRAQAQLDWISRVESAAGAELYGASKGRRLPFEIVGVRPRQYASFVSPSDRSAVLALGQGDMLLAQTAATLRGGGTELEITTTRGRSVVAGVVDDETSGGYEAMVRAGDLDPAARRDDFLLVLLRGMERRVAVERRLHSILGSQQVRTRLQGESPYLRYGDAVLPQMLVKHHFGEFAARPRPDGTIDVDPRWVSRNLATEEMPVLGPVTCHRGIVAQLRSALEQVVDDGLAFTLDPSQYAGCYGARFVNADPNGRLSHHAWGIAIDVNAASNAYGARPHQDLRLVEIMEAHGFTWGGRWLVPDGMHFEWADYPGR